MNSIDIKIGGRLINCKIKSSLKATRMNIAIRKQDLYLTVPPNVTFERAKIFLEESKKWIEKHIEKLSTGKENFLYFGIEIKIVHNSVLFAKNHTFNFENNILTITSPDDNTISTKDLYNIWIKFQARKFLPQRLDELAKTHHFTYNKVTIRETSTRWGSCSSRKTISLSSNLMKLSNNKIDYVMLHELCHTIELNHSNKFWKLLSNIFPDYQKYRKELRVVQ